MLDVIEVLAVWWHNENKNREERSFVTSLQSSTFAHEVQMAEGTWNTVPMKFPAAYHAVSGVVAGAPVVGASVPSGPLTTGAIAAQLRTS